MNTILRRKGKKGSPVKTEASSSWLAPGRCWKWIQRRWRRCCGSLLWSCSSHLGLESAAGRQSTDRSPASNSVDANKDRKGRIEEENVPLCFGNQWLHSSSSLYPRWPSVIDISCFIEYLLSMLTIYTPLGIPNAWSIWEKTNLSSAVSLSLKISEYFQKYQWFRFTHSWLSTKSQWFTYKGRQQRGDIISCHSWTAQIAHCTVPTHTALCLYLWHHFPALTWLIVFTFGAFKLISRGLVKKKYQH